MNIQINTQIDAYQTNCFPVNLKYVPRVGDYVQVSRVFKDHYYAKRLPSRLEVKSVTHSEDGVFVEVHYNKTDVQAMKLSGVNMLP